MPAYSSNYKIERRKRRFDIAEEGIYRLLQRQRLLGKDGRRMDAKVIYKLIQLLRRYPETV
jgi:hypothetical protein